MLDIGTPELIIVLIIIILLFGPGRIGKVAGELGKGIREFRNGVSIKDEQDVKVNTATTGSDTAKE
jgi:sec-independent protein translocase protein TatA